MDGVEKRAYISFAIAGVLLVVFVVVLVGVFRGGDEAEVPGNFSECVALGYPIAESYPRQCRTPDGTMFVEDVGDEVAKSDLVRVADPRPGSVVVSPYLVRGEARGTWFFEASFPIELRDASGNVIARAIADAQSDWMTEDFVRFEAILSFSVPEGDQAGTLLLMKDNPSGLPEHDDSFEIPIRLSR